MMTEHFTQALDLGGRRKSAIIRRKSAKRFFGMATSAI